MGKRWVSGGIAAGAIAAAIAISGAVIPALGAPGDEKGAYEALTPVRIFDTRTGLGGPAGAFTAGQTRDVQVTGVGGVPANATGVVLNVTLDGPSADTFVTVWPAGAPKPNSSTINATAGDLIANMVTLRVGAGGKVSVFNYAGNSHVIFDIAGYFTDRESPKVGRVHLTSALVPAGVAAGEITHFTATAPAAGVFIVTVEGHAWLDQDAGGALSVKGGGTLGVCTATATVDPVVCGITPGTFNPFISEDADNAASDNVTDAFALTRVIPVPAGDTTVYFNAQSTYAPFGTWGDLNATVTWLPGSASLPLVEGP